MSIKRYPVSTLANGTQIELYVHEIQGKLGDGPTIGMSAAIHGDEPTGTQILYQVAKKFMDGNFRGRLLIAPVANPPAFEANDRNTPIDSVNMNRVFPGNADGWFTEQLAAVLTKEFLQKIDIFIDFHAGGDLATVDYNYILNDEKLTRSFGSKVHYRPKEGFSGTMYQGLSGGITIDRGVPTMVVELGGGRVDQRGYVKRGVQGVTNVMATLGVLDKAPTPLPEQIVLNELAIIRPRNGGLLISQAPPLGEEVAKEAVIGHVVNPYTFEVIEVINNPFDRGIMVLDHLDTTVIFPGCYGYMIGNLDTAEAS